MATFAELGIPFRLFEADVGAASRFHAQGTCSLCGAAGPVLDLDAGTDLVVPCAVCWTENALDVDRRSGAPCRKCKTIVPFPAIASPITCCHACLSAGRAALTQDSELGMVRWEDAEAGRTHALPEGVDGCETVVGDDGWACAKIDRDVLIELVRTPRYVAKYGERWRFCCERVMVYVGKWAAADFESERSFRELVDEADEEAWAAMNDGTAATHFFRCSICGGQRGYCERPRGDARTAKG